MFHTPNESEFTCFIFAYGNTDRWEIKGKKSTMRYIGPKSAIVLQWDDSKVKAYDSHHFTEQFSDLGDH